MTGLYAYAAVSAPPSALGAGAQREPLRVIALDSLFVVAGETEEPPALAEATLRRHDAVVRAVARACDAVVPFRFASWFPDESSLKRDVSPMTGNLREALVLVRGCHQMTARLFDPRRARARAPRRAAIAGAGQGARYLAARAAADRGPDELTALRHALGALVRAERVECHEAPPLVATAYHLVERSRVRVYRAAVRALVGSLAPVTVTLSGPWPAYAFARGA